MTTEIRSGNWTTWARNRLVGAGMLLALPLAALPGNAEQAENTVLCEEPVVVEPPSGIEIAYGDHTDGCEVGPVLAVDRDRFHFEGLAGEEVRAVVFSGTNHFDPRIEIRDPNGDLIFDGFCTGHNQYGSGIRCSLAADVVLPMDGSYDVAVSDQGSNDLGLYRLQLESFPPLAAPPAIDYDTQVADALGVTTDVDFFSFEGEAGTDVRLDIYSGTNHLDPRIEVRDPSGAVAVVFDSYCVGHNQYGSGIRCSYPVPLSLTETGTYLVAVSDQGSNDLGSYEIGLQCLYGPCDSDGDGTPDAPAALVSHESESVASVASGTDGDPFRFQGSTGTVVQLDVLSRTNHLDPRLELRSPSGAVIHDSYCTGHNQYGSGIRCSFSTPHVPLGEDGMYTLMLSDAGLNDTGDYEFSLHCVEGPCDSDLDGVMDPEPPRLVYGGFVQHNVSVGTDRDHFVIQGTQGDDIGIDVFSQTNHYDAWVQLIAPSGAIVVDQYCTGHNQYGSGIKCTVDVDVTLQESGEHLLVLADKGTNESGGYQMALNCVFGTCENPTAPASRGDNCVDIPNAAPLDCDTDGDGRGNMCDGDFDQSETVNPADFTGYFLPDFMAGTDTGRGTDMDCSGSVNPADFTKFFMRQFLDATPGPGQECGGTMPCL